MLVVVVKVLIDRRIFIAAAGVELFCRRFLFYKLLPEIIRRCR